MSVFRLGDPEPVLTQDNHRNGNMGAACKGLRRARFPLGNGGESVGVENQVHSSGSIFSNSRSISPLMRIVSFRKWRSFPARAILTFGPAGDFASSLSATASLTNWRSGIRLSAALALARRKIASGISNVVFIIS